MNVSMYMGSIQSADNCSFPRIIYSPVTNLYFLLGGIKLYIDLPEFLIEIRHERKNIIILLLKIIII